MQSISKNLHSKAGFCCHTNSQSAAEMPQLCKKVLRTTERQDFSVPNGHFKELAQIRVFVSWFRGFRSITINDCLEDALRLGPLLLVTSNTHMSVVQIR